jgi:hypothetical protein
LRPRQNWRQTSHPFPVSQATKKSLATVVIEAMLAPPFAVVLVAPFLGSPRYCPRARPSSRSFASSKAQKWRHRAPPRRR